MKNDYESFNTYEVAVSISHSNHPKVPPIDYLRKI